MATIDSPWTSYTDTVTQKKVITDVISIIDPADAPTVEYLGGLDGAASKFTMRDWPSTTALWLEDTLPALTGSINMTVTLGANATSVTVADGSIFQPGHIILIDSCYFYISAVSGNTVTMATMSGTDATHASTAAIEIISMARLEGDDSDPVGMTSRGQGTNYTQIFQGEVKVTRTQRQLTQYGISDEFDYQAQKVIPGLMRQVDKHIVRTSLRAAGSATTPRIMGGIPTFVTTNLIAGTSLTKAKFDTAMQSIYEAGGSQRVGAILHPTNYAKVIGFYESSVYLRVGVGDAMIGMGAPQGIRTPFGDVDLIMDRWAATTVIPLIDPQHAGMLTFSPFTEEILSKTGDADKGEVVGEFTFCLRQEKAHALLTAVS